MNVHELMRKRYFIKANKVGYTDVYVFDAVIAEKPISCNEKFDTSSYQDIKSAQIYLRKILGTKIVSEWPGTSFFCFIIFLNVLQCLPLFSVRL